jgi:hypothetical protein
MFYLLTLGVAAEDKKVLSKDKNSKQQREERRVFIPK